MAIPKCSSLLRYCRGLIGLKLGFGVASTKDMQGFCGITVVGFQDATVLHPLKSHPATAKNQMPAFRVFIARALNTSALDSTDLYHKSNDSHWVLSVALG